MPSVVAYGPVALMPLVEARSVSLSSAGLVKMEERKRPASYDHDDSAPPLKRQATSVNGGSKGHPDDMPWKDELEVSPAISLKPYPFPPTPQPTHWHLFNTL